jgi:hypothetical protein
MHVGPVCRADINADKIFRRAAFEPTEKDLRGDAEDDEDDIMHVDESEEEYPATRSKSKGKERAHPGRRVIDEFDDEGDDVNNSDDDDFIVQSDEDEEEKEARRALRMRGRKAHPIVILDSDDEPETPEEKEVIFGMHKKAAAADGPIPTMSRFLPSTKMKVCMHYFSKFHLFLNGHTYSL